MTFRELKKTLSFFYPVYLLESVYSHRTRAFLLKIFFFLLLISFVLASGIFSKTTPALTATFFILLLVVLDTLFLEAFFFSYRFSKETKEFEYDLADIVFSSKEGDLTYSFFKSPIGYRALLRAGLDDESVDLFFDSRKNPLHAESLVIKEGGFKAKAYLSALLQSDHEFRSFLQAHSITEDVLWGSFTWASDLEIRALRNERWWSAERLSRFVPVGRAWAYGEAYALKRFSSPLRFEQEQEHELHDEEIRNLEVLLSKGSDANVLIVGDEGAGKMEIIEGLARALAHDTSSSRLRDTEYVVLSIDILLSACPDGQTLEKTLIALLNEVGKSGNVVLIIPDLPALIAGSSRIGCDCAELLSPYLRLSDIHIIAISSTSRFHSELRNHEDLLQHFEVLQVRDGSEEDITNILMEEVLKLESEEKVLFTYPAILEAVQSAKRYFVGSPLYDSASDLLIESVAKARLEGREIILPADILYLIKSKTGIATGEVESGERQKLMNLESLLHERVIGQDEAIKAVSDSLRRARSGINNPNRPLGSFLFLGPTGVGKTETTKALAEIFFGQQAKILRVDMSEYNTPDALMRLIGGYNGDATGVLAQMVRDHQYGVLLLDEFEKTDKKVLDLFLQIIDEGIFSDAQGKKVSARNLIIIATSNAGSQTIFDTVKTGKSIVEQRDSIVDSIIHEGVFKPELLNRFDGVILFRPLEDAQLRKVAGLMLRRLVWRMKEKGMTFIVNDALLDFLVKKGRDPKFGARPLNRAIQDTIEQRIAEGIIDGSYRAGSTIEFTLEQLHSL